MDRISDSDSEDAGSIPAGATKKQGECERESEYSPCFFFALALALYRLWITYRIFRFRLARRSGNVGGF